MKKIWNNLVRSGIEAGMAAELSSKVKLTNEVSLCLAIIAHCYIYIFWVLGYPREGMGVVIIVVAIALPVLLNRWRLYTISRLWLLLAFNIILLTYSFIFGEGAGIQFVYFVIAFLALTLFDIRQKQYTIIGAVMPAVCIFLFYGISAGKPIIAIGNYQQHLILYTVIFNNFVMLALFLRFWSRQMSRARNELTETYRNFFEDLPTPMFILDADGSHFLAINNKANKVYGYRNGDLTHRSYGDVAPGYEATLLQGSGIVDLGIQRHRKKNGDELYVHVITNTTTFYEAVARLVLVVDVHEKVITDRKNESLKLSLEQSHIENKYKSQFLANISHEFRTPLNSILIIAKLYLETGSQNFTARQLEYAQILYSSGKELQGFVDMIMEFSQYESGRLEERYERIDLQQMLAQMHRQFSVLAAEKDIKLTMAPSDQAPNSVFTLRLHFETILKNLVSNAIKFTDKQGHVDLHIGSNNGFLLVTVTDDGIGIPEEKQDLIFEPFEQANEFIKGVYGGTGLGLTICREIAQKLQGKIEVRSEVGKGSTFIFSLPLINSD